MKKVKLLADQTLVDIKTKEKIVLPAGSVGVVEKEYNKVLVVNIDGNYIDLLEREVEYLDKDSNDNKKVICSEIVVGQAEYDNAVNPDVIDYLEHLELRYKVFRDFGRKIDEHKRYIVQYHTETTKVNKDFDKIKGILNYEEIDLDKKIILELKEYTRLLRKAGEI